MMTHTAPSPQYLISGIYEQTLTVARSAAFEEMVKMMELLIACHPSDQPFYLLQDTSSLDLAYTPRLRAFAESLVHRLHECGKITRVAIVVPAMVGNCTDFLNCLLRQQETAEVRHLCFATRKEALSWLQTLQHSESLPAAQGF